MKNTDWIQFLTVGDTESFSAIYYEYVDVLYGYGMKITHNAELVNECIVSLFQYIYDKRTSITCPDNPMAYMLVSYKRLLIKSLKNERSKKEQSLDDIAVDRYRFDMEIDVQSSLIQTELEEEQLKALQSAIDQLTPQQREVIYLKYYKKLNASEIADVLGVTCRSVYNVTQNAINRLRSNKLLTKAALFMVSLFTTMIR